MFGYYLDLARRSFKRNVALTMLMIVAIGFGVGASMTTLTVLRLLSADPIPAKSHHLHYVQLEPRPLKGYHPGEEPNEQSTRADAEALVRAHRADRQALMTGGSAAVEPQRAGLDPFRIDGRWTTSEFFPMFDVPFVKGSGWSDQDDAAHARVAVISRALAEKVFGSPDVIGFPIRVAGTELRVVGVIENWRVVPHFYDLADRCLRQGRAAVRAVDDVARSQARPRRQHELLGQHHDDAEALGAPCEWIQVWVELDSDAKLAAYREFLVHYSEDRIRAGVFERPPNVRLRDVREWLDYNHVVPNDAKLQTWVALGFLLVCLINTVGLLLTKFLRRSAEIGVRRALGASKHLDLRAAPRRGRRARHRRRVVRAWCSRGSGCGRSATSRRRMPSSPSSIYRCSPRRSDSRSSRACWRASCRRGAAARSPPRSSSSRIEVPMNFIPILSSLRRHRTAATLIVLEIAFTCAIVCNAVFVIRDRIGRMDRPSGVTEDEIVRLQIAGIGQKTDPNAITREDLAALRAIPGVKTVAVTNMVPFGGSSWNSSISTIPDDPSPPINVATYMGSRDLIETLGVKLTAGRDLLPAEYLELSATASSNIHVPAVLITQGVANRMFPGQSAIGKPLYVWGDQPSTVVGVIDTLARPNDFQAGEAERYAIVMPLDLDFTVGGNYLLRTDPARQREVLAAAEAAVKRVDPNRLVLQHQTFGDIRRDHFKQDRAMAWLLGGVSIALLIITALGVIGLASFWVQQRTRQIGVRRALGATRADIRHYFQIENFILATAGIVLGMALAYGINLWLMDRYEVARLPASFLPIGAGLLWILGQLAVLGPAMRAAAIPPAIATRSV